MRSFNMKRDDQGYIMQLQNFSVNDGSGVRTVIFMCGCPLECIWCCNPENRYYFDDDHLMTVDRVAADISRISMFLKRGGGITFSGGECTVQQGFLRSLTETFYDRGYDLAMETCGYWDYDEIEDILSRMNMIFFDLKIMDPELHRRYTGKDNGIICNNLEKLADAGIPLVVRIPVIEGINADTDNMQRTFSFMREKCPSAGLELLPYHRFGRDKYTELGLAGPESVCRMDIPSDEKMSGFAEMAEQYGIQVVSFK